MATMSNRAPRVLGLALAAIGAAAGCSGRLIVPASTPLTRCESDIDCKLGEECVNELCTAKPPAFMASRTRWAMNQAVFIVVHSERRI